jgi:putative ABC transport system permease protein
VNTHFVLTLLRIALRNLARQRRRTLLVLLAVGLGVTAVVGVRGFLNGLQSSLVLGFAEGTIGAIQVHRAGFLQSVDAAPLTPNIDIAAKDEAGRDVLARIEAIEGVRASSARITFPAMISVEDQSGFALIVAADPERELVTSPKRKDHVVTGAWLTSATTAGQATSSLMGMELARSLGAKEAARVALLTNDVDGVMNAVDTSLVGTLAAPTQGEKKLVIIPLNTAQELLRIPGRATEIVVGVHELDDVDAVASRIRSALGAEYEVHTWKDLAPVAKDVVETQNAALGIVTVIFLVVILMGLANALLTSVLERVREIGTMLAVGAKRRQVLTMFVIEAALIGILGALVGCALGSAIVFALSINGITLTTPGASIPQHLVPYVEVKFLVRMVALCVVGATIASLWPAWRASRLRPVEALASPT